MIKGSPEVENKINAENYTQHPDVLQCIADLKEKFGNNYENLVVSDTTDDQGHQYVNLVQKGGGVLGVALVGYTFILEQAGIRFLRLAGTSAGAINTALL
ncbi:MAG: patatin-like phospholipase family protein, partial [Ginsengibacter sp.]